MVILIDSGFTDFIILRKIVYLLCMYIGCSQALERDYWNVLNNVVILGGKSPKKDV